MAMHNPQTTLKTGKGSARALRGTILALALSCLAHSGAARAADVEFTAQADRSQVSLDDSVSLKMTVQSEGVANVSEPTFSAPDFDVVNEYRGTYVESYYDGTTGRFGMRNNQQITKVLKPSKQGALRISRISVRVNGKPYT